MIPTTPPLRRFKNAENIPPSAFGTRVKIVSAASIPPESIKWIWHGWIAAGKLHMLAGQPGAGKTGTAVSIAATISRGDSGGRWPDGTEAPPGNVVVWTCEDGVADTIIPRLIFTAPHEPAAPHAPHASVEPHASVVPLDNEGLLATALQLAVQDAQRTFSSREKATDVLWEDFIYEIEDDVTENLVDDSTLLAELRSRLRAQNWWVNLPRPSIR